MRMLQKTLLWAFTAIIATALLAVAGEHEGVTKDDIPAAVLKAFEQANPYAQASGFDAEEHDGKMVYEIETKVGKADKDFVYLEDGTLLQVEEGISVEALPKVVADAALKAHPKGELDEAEKITRSDTVEYEVVVEVNDKEFELLVASDGSILSSSESEEDEDEDEHEDDD